jgi:hypothetical protein
MVAGRLDVPASGRSALRPYRTRIIAILIVQSFDRSSEVESTSCGFRLDSKE